MLRRLPLLIALVSVFTACCLLSEAREAGAFFQTTKVEGTIGTDLGGVWLAVHQVVPTFRVRMDRTDTIVPFKVTAVSEELAPLMGASRRGVVISEITDQKAATKYGVFKGDVITKVNIQAISDVASFNEGLSKVGKWLLLTIRRPRLKFTTVRLLKIRYEAEEHEEEGSSSISDEKIDVKVLDAILPFTGLLESMRRKNQLWFPGKEDVRNLVARWYRLPMPDKPLFVSGQHRVVAESDYDSSLRKDENLRDTRFAIVSTLQGNPLTAGGGKSISIYGIQSASAEQLAGTYVESTIANAPFPISIEFDGMFTMTRLADFSNKDVDYRMAKAHEHSRKEQEDVKLAPDIPEN